MRRDMRLQRRRLLLLLTRLRLSYLMLSYLRFQLRNRSQRLNPNRFLSNRLR